MYRKSTTEIILRPPSTHKNEEIVSTNQKTRLPCQVSSYIINTRNICVIKDKKHLHGVNWKALKEVLDKLKLDKKTLFEESFGHLEYVCMIPRVWLILTVICLSFLSIHHLCHLYDFVDREIKMHSTGP